mmetsp:Transcript_14180/g.21640  ORF Transcript_14180/g.21640 Transcript_14180/m.21640 type:complete len:230 (+) Transcript_14180:183-872(+)|eukprot:CAMPEP_0178922556 /NCGR_PEP_ID=MMETSP0786-20121207/16224_1 /TAXON_ID=186022 /ORGANISM="Thalassionema frauenfeldii, Strain CCMP 1798" /LENGTH=229 /DNA_ID=CAMNT_0020596943 /DNA_START=175 /DNA_END=864 /DNA_ORIENTATION=+
MRFFLVHCLISLATARISTDNRQSQKQSSGHNSNSLSSTISKLQVVFGNQDEGENWDSVMLPDERKITSNSMASTKNECEDPVAAILETLRCIEQEEVRCASAGYNQRVFRKLHNGIDTNTKIGRFFWIGGFALLDFKLAIDHVYQIAPNQVGIRYVETVTTTDGSSLFLKPSNEFPFSQTFFQHEHALVTVDENCKMVLWDQTGDNKEQTDVDNVADDIVCRVNPLCT